MEHLPLLVVLLAFYYLVKFIQFLILFGEFAWADAVVLLEVIVVILRGCVACGGWMFWLLHLVL